MSRTGPGFGLARFFDSPFRAHPSEDRPLAVAASIVSITGEHGRAPLYPAGNPSPTPNNVVIERQDALAEALR